MFEKESFLSYLHEKEGLKEVRARIQALRKEKNSEYLILSNGEKINLEWIRSVNGIIF